MRDIFVILSLLFSTMKENFQKTPDKRCPDIYDIYNEYQSIKTQLIIVLDIRLFRLVFGNRKQKGKNREKLFFSIFLPTFEFKIIIFIISTDQPIFVPPSARRTIIN